MGAQVYLINQHQVVLYGCESWTIKKAEPRRIDAFEVWCWRRFFRVPWTARRSNQSILKEMSAEYQWMDWCWSSNANTWPPEVKKWLNGKDPDAGKDWRQEEKGTTEDEMAGGHHRLQGCEFEWTPGDGDGQGGLACCDSWGRKESDTTERLNWTELMADLHKDSHKGKNKCNSLDFYITFRTV